MLTDNDTTIFEKSRQDSNLQHLTKMVQELYRRSVRENLVTLGNDYKAYVRFRLAIVFDKPCTVSNVPITDMTFEFCVRWSELSDNELPKKLKARIIDYLVEHCTEGHVPYWIKPVGIVKPK